MNKDEIIKAFAECKRKGFSKETDKFLDQLDDAGITEEALSNHGLYVCGEDLVDHMGIKFA